ncbi:MAG: DUF933 domain-containing protein [Candidatus Omnitrophica bacterium]|nr:DUF933 domain-containing protein [Candidatus Omnitrophota bacterium]
MKIAFLGFDFAEGKTKYMDNRLISLSEKFSPQKTTYFSVEFLKEDFAACDAMILSKVKSLDLFILDMDKLDVRQQRITDDKEKEFFKKCIGYLEKEIPLCDVEFSPEESLLIREIAPYSLKPTLIQEEQLDTKIIIEKILEKSKVIFFYTVGKKEVRAWPVDKDSDIITCAGKIHSDLARGFIKADVINFNDFTEEHSMQTAKAKGLVKLVDRDYIIQDGDIIEIRFNV